MAPLESLDITVYSVYNYIIISQLNLNGVSKPSDCELSPPKQLSVSAPTLTVSTELQNLMPGRAIWLDDELYSFLHQGGSNPFGDDSVTNNSNHIDYGFGWEEDSFDPDHERPHVHDYDLAGR
ncbi:hypothetical protein VE03_04760 [Pseudogymnoascus sp. 23342-1-I1]|nr:hypothetical protein VE03_04760 [Pseudogymnoascus sp. 23342-1-I1]